MARKRGLGRNVEIAEGYESSAHDWPSVRSSCIERRERSVVFPPLTISCLCLEYVVSNETGRIDDENLLTHMNEPH